MPAYIADSYDEFKFSEHFGLAVSYADLPAHQVDWWKRFIQMDQEVENELRERANKK